MLFDFDRLREDLAGFSPDQWTSRLIDLSQEKTSVAAHGNLADWQETLGRLPDVGKHTFNFDGNVISARFNWPGDTNREARDEFQKLIPWRKGPFDIAGIEIDTEWCSDLKWRRLENSISPLTDRRILDVGCGNGYYALRMLDLGARLVLGIDPTLLYVVQFAALTHFMRPVPVHILPLRLHELPASGPLFDTAFSMGVLYHQRDPIEHLTQLKETLRIDGELVLESLVIPGDLSDVMVPDKRYARMRNVWHVPTITRLTEWLDEAGFTDARVIDQTITTIDEQRTTQWMPFESLSEALDPSDASTTVEGLPAPMRVVMICKNTKISAP